MKYSGSARKYSPHFMENPRFARKYSAYFMENVMRRAASPGPPALCAG
jgi:hypothetical protein